MATANDVQDRRIKTVNHLLKTRHIKHFADIFNYIPPTVVARQAGFTPEVFLKRRLNPKLFTLDDIYRMADFFEYDRLKMVQLVHNAASK